MAITKDKKKDILSKLEKVANSASVVFINFKGLSVNKVNEIRKTLKDLGISYFVTKKTLIKKAFGEKNIEGEIPSLEGELAVVYGDDPIAPAREINSFVKKFENTLSIIGGIFQNKFQNKAQMQEIASIPDAKTLQGMFVNVVNSPIQRFVIALQAVADKK